MTGNTASEERTTDNADLREGLKSAASAAAVGAAVGAARALGARRGRRPSVSEEEPDTPAEETQEEEEPVADADDLEPESEPLNRDDDDDDDRHDEQAEPATPQAIRDCVAEARTLLRDLLGADAESVSSVHRTTHGWKVGLIVVEVRRIPDSTDVLANYDVQFDDDGGVLGIERTRRYHRSEADRGGRS